MITKAQAEGAVFAFDLLMTALDRVAEKIAEAQKQGLIPVADQQARMDKVDAIRKQVGLPDPSPES